MAERPCSICHELHVAKSYYCNSCRATYMRDWRKKRRIVGEEVGAGP